MKCLWLSQRFGLVWKIKIFRGQEKNLRTNNIHNTTMRVKQFNNSNTIIFCQIVDSSNKKLKFLNQWITLEINDWVFYNIGKYEKMVNYVEYISHF